MISRIFVLFLVVLNASFSVEASVMFLEAKTYRCSDGMDYDVLRHYSGYDVSSGGWTLVGLCNKGILTKSEYNGRVLNPRNSDPEVARCQDEDTPAVRACYDEFIHYNGSKGVDLPKILHGRGERQPRKNDSGPIPPGSTGQACILHCGSH